METMGGDDSEVGGTVPQRIASCMAALGTLLALPHAVAASMVLADKRRAAAASSDQDLVQQVANILGERPAGSADGSVFPFRTPPGVHSVSIHQ